MAEDVAALLARLASAEGGDLGIKELLDAVVLAAAWAHSDRGDAGSSSAATAGDAERDQKQGQASDSAPTQRTRTAGSGHAMGMTREPAASVWLEDQRGTHAVAGKRVSIGRSPALPDALDIGRALRPLRRPWLSGVHRRLDVDATVEHYTRTGMLVPLLTPAPEPWLEAIVVLDRGTAMAVWDETVHTLTKTLRALAAFRDVRVWQLEHPPGGAPILHDHHGSGLALTEGAAHHTQPARRLLLVVTDCAAPAWRQDVLWQTLHAWGRTAPVALINPLPKRLWQRSGLDLPHTTAVATVPASPGSRLSYRRPRLLRETQETKPWQALPVLQFDPTQILAWARTLMRTDPSGCEAVLVPATGRPPLRHRRRPRPTSQPEPVDAYDQVRSRAEAFADNRESPAVRLAIAASPLGSFTLPVLDVLRDRLVPDAALADTAEFLTAGLLAATPSDSADTVYQFHPAAAAHLTSLLTRDKLWDTHFALSDHLAAHVQAPHGIPLILRSPHSDETLTTGVRPIAYAAATTARLLGVEVTDALPVARRRPMPALAVELSSEEQRGTAPITPMASEDGVEAEAAQLYRILARHFRSLLTKASSVRGVRPSEDEQREMLLERDSPRKQGSQRTRMAADAPNLSEARQELVISVNVAPSAALEHAAKGQMRGSLYRLLEMAFADAGVPWNSVLTEDRGDGVLLSIASDIPDSRMLGRWLFKVHEELRIEIRDRDTPLRLRIGIHAGPVRHDEWGMSGGAVDLACRLADTEVARQLLGREGADLLLVFSESLFEDVVKHGGPFITPGPYSTARLSLKQGTVTAWFHVFNRPADHIPAALGSGRQEMRAAGEALELGAASTELVLSVEASRSGAHDDIELARMRAGIYRVLESAFAHAKIALEAVHMEDRGDGVLLTISGRVPASRLLGRWLLEVHVNLRDENHELAAPLALRIGMDVGPVRHDRGISGRSVDLACRLANTDLAQGLLDTEGADLVVVVSQRLYDEVVSHGGRFIDPELYFPHRLALKGGEVTCWFHLPGRPAPQIPAGLTQRKGPDELASITQDLTLLLENIAVPLAKGKYPDSASGKQIAGLLRTVADEFDFFSENSPSPGAVHQRSPVQDESGAPTQDHLVEAVMSACRDLLGRALGDPSEADVNGFWALGGIVLPPGLTDLTIHDITPDTSSIAWDTVEAYEHGLVLGQVMVDAHLTLEGLMHKSDYFAEGDARLLYEVNDHMVEVSVERNAQLLFDARRDLETIELAFYGVNSSEAHPRDGHRRREAAWMEGLWAGEAVVRNEGRGMATAIRTSYGGARFHSRLEARWAVFFDTLGIRWEYEPEEHLLDGQPYRPDFRLLLGDRQVFAEVKHAAQEEHESKHAELCRALAQSTRHVVLLLVGEPECRLYHQFAPDLGPESFQAAFFRDYEPLLVTADAYWFEQAELDQQTGALRFPHDARAARKSFGAGLVEAVAAARSALFE
ncbi:SAV_2336 N-terminal domain-related protein [Streptomyces chartreusis]|uniref:SAV_2336 N-terminal domain-related protein n=1 Tax=Streptomyces chartreusis TaxID=1969 RepID=UPI001C3FB774|nr:SAV_2336 N-terminal domain-related protein [Streptomyces chartreusis]